MFYIYIIFTLSFVLSSFQMLQISFFHHFFSVLRTSFSCSFRVGLLVRNLISFSLSENAFFPLHL